MIDECEDAASDFFVCLFFVTTQAACLFITVEKQDKHQNIRTVTKWTRELRRENDGAKDKRLIFLISSTDD